MSARALGPQLEDVRVLLPRLEAHRTTPPGPAYKLAALNAAWVFHGEDLTLATTVCGLFGRIRDRGLPPELLQVELEELLGHARRWYAEDRGGLS